MHLHGIHPMLRTLINPIAGVEVLEKHEKYFIDHMNTQIISETLQSKQIIPVHLQMKVLDSAERREANGLLFDYLMSNGTRSSLLALCEVVKTAKGASEKMIALGEDMLLKLEQGVCLCTCVCSSVHMCAYV